VAACADIGLTAAVGDRSATGPQRIGRGNRFVAEDRSRPPKLSPGRMGFAFLDNALSSLLGCEGRPVPVGDLTLTGLLQPTLAGLVVDGAPMCHPVVTSRRRREQAVGVGPERVV
jgi:hypothetical protein